MQTTVILYLQLHQPYRINSQDPRTATSWKDWFIGEKVGKSGLDMTNRHIFELVASRCYIPVAKFWKEFLNSNPSFKLNLSITGTLIDQCLEYGDIGKEVLQSLQDLVATGQVELCSETYYHSLACMIDREEFISQIEMHRQAMQKYFGKNPVSFRNTELIYNDHIGEIVQNLGFQSQIIEAPLWNQVNQSWAGDTIQPEYFKPLAHSGSNQLTLFPRDSDISDGLIFITADSTRLQETILFSNKKLILIGTDFEFLGEHFLDYTQVTESISRQIQYLLEKDVKFATVSEVTKVLDKTKTSTYAAPQATSWGHLERDISVWRGNPLQEQAFDALMQLYRIVNADYPDFLPVLRCLSTSCHFYFLGQKDGQDAEFVQLFSPYQSTQIALANYLQVIHELTQYITTYA